MKKSIEKRRILLVLHNLKKIMSVYITDKRELLIDSMNILLTSELILKRK